MSPPSRTGRGWGRRTALAAAVAVGVVVGTTLLELEPRPVSVGLLVVLGVAALGLLLDVVAVPPVVWQDEEVHRRPLLPGRDATTFAHLRLLEDHRTSAHPDGHLQARLRGLAAEVLRARHDVSGDSEEARRLLGEPAWATLHGPVRRLTPRTLGDCLHAIEEL